MSVHAISWVLKNSKSKGNARCVLFVIANYVNDDATNAYPSVETIVRESGCSRATVFRCLEQLKAMGELDWVPGGGKYKSNYYSMPGFRNSLNLRRLEGNGLKSVPKRSQMSVDTVSPLRPNPLKNLLKNQEGVRPEEPRPHLPWVGEVLGND